MTTKNAATKKIRPPAAAGDDPDNQFDRFWNAYPRCIDKKDTRRAFAKALTKAPFEMIMAGLAAYPFNPDPALQPHPSTWLNKERWEGYITRAPATLAVPTPGPSRSDWLDRPLPGLFDPQPSQRRPPPSYYSGVTIESTVNDAPKG